jgi:hypothetical protein
MAGITSGDIAKWTADEAKRIAGEAMGKANQVTDILCRILRGMPEEQIAKMDPDIQAWFAEHKEYDAQHGRG